jgi:hypothetical protein
MPPVESRKPVKTYVVFSSMSKADGSSRIGYVVFEVPITISKEEHIHQAAVAIKTKYELDQLPIIISWTKLDG